MDYGLGLLDWIRRINWIMDWDCWIIGLDLKDFWIMDWDYWIDLSGFLDYGFIDGLIFWAVFQ